jgi:hypothetical protein
MVCGSPYNANEHEHFDFDLLMVAHMLETIQFLGHRNDDNLLQSKKTLVVLTKIDKVLIYFQAMKVLLI